MEQYFINEQIKDLAYTIKESINRHQQGIAEVSDIDTIVHEIITNSHLHNSWFVPAHMLFALELFVNDLEYIANNDLISQLKEGEVSLYSEKLINGISENNAIKSNLLNGNKNLACLLRTNGPMEGMAELFLLAGLGYKCVVKVSPEMKQLLKNVLSIAALIENSQLNISETESRFTEIGALIAMAELGETTKDYFGKYPTLQLFCKGKSYVIGGNESDELIEYITMMVCMYFGRGTRNIKVLFVPEQYDIARLKSSFEQYNDQLFNNRYFNNYEYRKSALIINHIAYSEVGPLLITEDSRQAGYTGVLCIQRYNSIHDIMSNKLADEYSLINAVGEEINIHDRRMNLSALIGNYNEIASFIETI